MIKLEHFVLDSYKEEYESIKNEFETGKSKSNFISDISKRLYASRNNNSFFGSAYVVLNNLEPIGYVYISGISNDDIYIECAILHNKRKLGYASLLLKELTDYIFSNYNIRQIKLDISLNNQGSIMVAKKNGFDVDEEDFENRGYSNKMIFVKDNLFYEN